MSAIFLIRVTVCAAILRFAGRRWHIPYLEGAVSILLGSLFLQSVRTTSLWHGWHVYGIAVLGLLMIGAGANNLWRHRASHPVEGS